MAGPTAQAPKFNLDRAAVRALRDLLERVAGILLKHRADLPPGLMAELAPALVGLVFVFRELEAADQAQRLEALAALHEKLHGARAH
jgi:hypothetical protein